MFYAQSTAKGHIRVKLNVFLPQVKILIHSPSLQDYKVLNISVVHAPPDGDTGYSYSQGKVVLTRGFP